MQSAAAGSGMKRTASITTSLLIEGRDAVPLRVRSLVGLIPLLAVRGARSAGRSTGCRVSRSGMRWFLDNRPDLARHISCMDRQAARGLAHASAARDSLARAAGARARTTCSTRRSFSRPSGIRSLSRTVRRRARISSTSTAADYRIDYEPAESRSDIFGGNSNWRGPIWFPVNYLLIEALERYHHFYGDTLTRRVPDRLGEYAARSTQVAHEIARRLSRIFTLDENGQRPCFGDNFRYAEDPHWRDHLLFHEYFHARHRLRPRRESSDRLDGAHHALSRDRGARFQEHRSGLNFAMQLRWIFPESNVEPARPLASELDVAPFVAELALGPRNSHGGRREPFPRSSAEDAQRSVFAASHGRGDRPYPRGDRRRERIVLYGDYDVDGVTSLALLTRVLRACGGGAECFLPSRMDEGYGLSADGVARCVNTLAPQLLIAVDCGTSSARGDRGPAGERASMSSCSIITNARPNCRIALRW